VIWNWAAGAVDKLIPIATALAAHI